MIYFINSDGRADCIKIGYTRRDPQDRLRKLQTATPDQLRLIGAVEGERYLERMLHKRYQHLRIRGEWFRIPEARMRVQIALLKKQQERQMLLPLEARVEPRVEELGFQVFVRAA